MLPLPGRSLRFDMRTGKWFISSSSLEVVQHLLYPHQDDDAAELGGLGNAAPEPGLGVASHAHATLCVG